MPILFYSARERPYGCFSNFSAHGFVLDDVWWPTSEHYFQAQKFVGTLHVEQVRLANSPKEAARLGRQRTFPLRSDWEKVKDGVMLNALLCKFETHADIRTILLSTGDEEIIENAPTIIIGDVVPMGVGVTCWESFLCRCDRTCVGVPK